MHIFTQGISQIEIIPYILKIQNVEHLQKAIIFPPRPE